MSLQYLDEATVQKKLILARPTSNINIKEYSGNALSFSVKLQDADNQLMRLIEGVDRKKGVWVCVYTLRSRL